MQRHCSERYRHGSKNKVLNGFKHDFNDTAKRHTVVGVLFILAKIYNVIKSLIMM